MNSTRAENFIAGLREIHNKPNQYSVSDGDEFRLSPQKKSVILIT